MTEIICLRVVGRIQVALHTFSSGGVFITVPDIIDGFFRDQDVNILFAAVWREIFDKFPMTS